MGVCNSQSRLLIWESDNPNVSLRESVIPSLVCLMGVCGSQSRLLIRESDKPKISLRESVIPRLVC